MRINMTLYEHLEAFLFEHGKKITDILWVGGEDFRIPLDNFFDLAQSVGDQKHCTVRDLPFDIVIVGADFWLERTDEDILHILQEDDYFIYREFPNKPTQEKKLNYLTFEQYIWQLRTFDEIEKAFRDFLKKTNNETLKLKHLSYIPKI